MSVRVADNASGAALPARLANLLREARWLAGLAAAGMPLTQLCAAVV